MNPPPPPTELIEFIAKHSPHEPDPALRALIDALLARYGAAVQAILFYGSCRRNGDALDGLVDLYVIVESYRAAYGGWALSTANAVLPPNVFYLEQNCEQGTVRGKYAVLSMRHLQRGVSRWFHSYLWGRFAQPTGVLYARNDIIAREIDRLLAQAVLTFVARTLPQAPPEFTAVDLWTQGLGLSYRTELRAERPDRTAALVAAQQDYYEALTAATLAATPYPVDFSADSPPRYRVQIPARTRRTNRLAWTLRRGQGKLLSLARLVKAVFTFRGGVDYIVWKLERHSGMTIEVTPKVRRYPLLYGWGLMWRLYRRGAFR